MPPSHSAMISPGFEVVVAEIIEQHVADAAADDDAEHGPEGEVPDRRAVEGRAVVIPQAVPAEQQGGVGRAAQDAGEMARAYQRTSNGPRAKAIGWR